MSKLLDYAGMALCSSCFTGKDTYSHAFWTNHLPGFVIYMDSAEECVDGKLGLLTY